jgi:phospholipid/cholesterol/gamma-HCH transport system permease protein
MAVKGDMGETAMEKGPEAPGLAYLRPGGETLTAVLSGAWMLGEALPSEETLREEIASGPPVRRLAFEAGGLGRWDSALLTFLIKVREICSSSGVQIEDAGLPEGARRLLKLASAVPERKGARKEAGKEPLLARIGGEAFDFVHGASEMFAFIGEASLAVLKLVSGRARFRRSDLLLFLEESGAQALPIVSLICGLVGLILAFVGAVQLRMFGAQVYVADLVGIAMVRVMGAIMTGIIMAGRTGASFAAQLGTMQVNEEIDALQTLGISPMEFLVLPRMIALAVMMPLLCLYADVMGILGGLIVGVAMLGISPVTYLAETQAAVSLTNLWIGLFHSAVFGVLVALAGCLRGMQCGRSASAVGYAATSAVVTGIVSIIVSTAVITVLCDILGI